MGRTSEICEKNFLLFFLVSLLRPQQHRHIHGATHHVIMEESSFASFVESHADKPDAHQTQNQKTSNFRIIFPIATGVVIVQMTRFGHQCIMTAWKETMIKFALGRDTTHIK